MNENDIVEIITAEFYNKGIREKIRRYNPAELKFQDSVMPQRIKKVAKAIMDKIKENKPRKASPTIEEFLNSDNSDLP